MIDKASVQVKPKTNFAKLLDGAILYAPFIIALVCFACCLVLEILHVDISQESRAQIYSTFGTVTFVFSILLNTVYGRKYKIGWLRCLIFSLASFYIIHVYTSQGLTWLDIQMFGVGTIISSRSLILLPILCLILARFCKIDTLNLCDYFTPYYFFNHGLVTVACWIEGCCAGRPCFWGIYNPLSGTTAFPTQPCIILLSLAVSFWGLYYSKKHDYKANGIVFANSMCIYGIGRYVIELFSDDARVWRVLSWFSICSLIMIAEGFLIRYISGKRYNTPS